MKKTTVIYFIGFIILLVPSLVKADNADDEECIICDMLIGAAIAVCETDETCNSFMTIVSIMAICVSILSCIFGDEETRDEIWDNVPSGKQSASMGVGYGLARAYMD